MTVRAAEAQRHLERAAKKIGPRLHGALCEMGPVAFPSRARAGLVRVLAQAIVGQQLSSKVARVFWDRTLAAARETGEGLPGLFAPHNERRLRGIGLSGMKVSFLLSLRDAAQAGHLSAVRIKRMGHVERTAHLSSLRGIGPWTCDMIGIFYCRDPDIWPQGDLAVRRTFADLAEVAEAEAPERTEAFAPYRTWLALHMWRWKNAASGWE